MESTPLVRLPPGPDEAEILDRFGIGPEALLGSGNEARTFALPDGHTVLRISPAQPEEPEAEPSGVERRLQRLLAGFGAQQLALPMIVGFGVTGRQRWRVDRRIPGVDLASVLRRSPDTTHRRALLTSYLEVVLELHRLPSALIEAAKPWGRPILGEAFATLSDLMNHLLDSASAWSLLGDRVPDLGARVADLRDRFAHRRVAPALVHADYCPGNVYTDGSRVIGVGDWSVHALHADPVLDVAGAVAFVELEPYPEAVADAAWLAGLAAERLGADAEWIEAYRRYHGLYYSMDDEILPWCAAQLLR